MTDQRDIFNQVDRVYSKHVVDDYFKFRIDKKDGVDPFDLIVADGITEEIANTILKKSYITQSKDSTHDNPVTIYEARVGVIFDLDEFTRIVNEAINDAYIRGVERGLESE